MLPDNYLQDQALYLPTTVGRYLTGRPRRFTQWLVENKVLYREGRALKARLKWENQGYLCYQSTGDEDNYEQVYFTEQGLAWIESRYDWKEEQCPS